MKLSFVKLENGSHFVVIHEAVKADKLGLYKHTPLLDDVKW